VTSRSACPDLNCAPRILRRPTRHRLNSAARRARRGRENAARAACDSSGAGSDDPDEPTSRGVPRSILVAWWENADSLLTLIRGSYTPEFQLILVPKSLNARARAGIREAVRLDGVEAPRRDAAQRKKEGAITSTSSSRPRIHS
jgi:hypothetical protein